MYFVVVIVSSSSQQRQNANTASSRRLQRRTFRAFLWCCFYLALGICGDFDIALPFSRKYHDLFSRSNCYGVLASTSSENLSTEEEDILAELLADERRHHDELEQLETEMRLLNDLESKRKQQNQTYPKQKMQPRARATTTLGSDGMKSRSFQQLEEELRNKETQINDAKRKANEDAEKEAKQKDTETLAAQREAAFQAEINRVNDPKVRRFLEREKARDSNIVRRILRDSKSERHYSVLGIKCRWGTVKLGPISFCKVTTADIKRAYRNTARRVHPDKNRDGQAGLAFDALEKSAAILMDEKLRREYDMKIVRRRKEAFDEIRNGTFNFFGKIFQLSLMLKRLCGPVALPVLLITAIVI